MSVLTLATVAGGSVVLTIAAVGLSIGMALAFFRLVAGPSIADRVVAIDLMGTLCVALIALWSIASGEPAILSVAIVMALILFLGTAAFALYLERRAKPDDASGARASDESRAVRPRIERHAVGQTGGVQP